MTQKQRIYRNALLAKIHTHPKYKEIREAGAWEDYMYARFECESSALLGIEELHSLIECLNGSKEGTKNIKGRVMLLGTRQDRKILLLAEDLGMKGILNEFIYRQTKKRSLQECNKEEKTKIIVGLEKIKREKR